MGLKFLFIKKMQNKLTDIKLLLRKPAFWAGIILIIVLIVLLVELIFSIRHAKQTAEMILTPEEKQVVPTLDWTNSEIRTLIKEKLWLETQLALSKEDSMSLGINLRDSILQVQMKGLPLIQSKILYIRPEGYLSEIDAPYYSKLFGKPVDILNGISNLTKKPIRKMKVIEGSEAIPVKSDSVITKRFYWEFITDNNLRIVINGCEPTSDTIFKKPPFTTDMVKFRLRSKSKDLNEQKYYPVLFLWMSDKEAKAIYRALPAKTKLAIRN